MHETDQEDADLEYWLSRPHAERIAAVTFLVSQTLKPGQRMDKTVVRKTTLHADRDKAAGRAQDIADVQKLKGKKRK